MKNYFWFTNTEYYKSSQTPAWSFSFFHIRVFVMICDLNRKHLNEMKIFVENCELCRIYLKTYFCVFWRHEFTKSEEVLVKFLQTLIFEDMSKD